eukprot:355422-Chlamydomonas_euryale.AAC.1
MLDPVGVATVLRRGAARAPGKGGTRLGGPHTCARRAGVAIHTPRGQPTRSSADEPSRRSVPASCGGSWALAARAKLTTERMRPSAPSSDMVQSVKNTHPEL